MLCPSCCEEIIREQISRCYICNKLTSQQLVCSSCRSKSSLRRVWWLGNYDTTLKELIFMMKYQRRRAYARSFGELLAARIPYLPDDTLVVSAPTAPRRIRVRGYDQARLIGESLSQKTGLSYKPILYRTTQVDQIGKRRSERLKQMKNSIALLPKSSVSGKSVLIVDDVLTTGATLEAAARLLRDHGAKHVDAAVIARHHSG